MTTATTTELQQDFGKYLQMVQAGGEVIILKNGKEVARLISHEKSILKGDYDDKMITKERMQKYENIG